MTTVFVSYRDVAQLGAPAGQRGAALTIRVPSVFAAAGIMMIASAMLTRHIPRRL